MDFFGRWKPFTSQNPTYFVRSYSRASFRNLNISFYYQRFVAKKGYGIFSFVSRKYRIRFPYCESNAIDLFWSLTTFCCDKIRDPSREKVCMESERSENPLESRLPCKYWRNPREMARSTRLHDRD